MAEKTVSLWFDLFHATGMAEAGNAPVNGKYDKTKGISVHQAAVASLVIKNIYLGDFEKDTGHAAKMGFWEWIPRCISDNVCGYPLPAEWSKTVRGGWHWELERNQKRKPFVALDKEKPLGTKIGAINEFKVEDFKGYNPQNKNNVTWKFNASYGHWVINDGKFTLSGTWQFVNLIYGNKSRILLKVGRRRNALRSQSFCFPAYRSKQQNQDSKACRQYHPARCRTR